MRAWLNSGVAALAVLAMKMLEQQTEALSLMRGHQTGPGKRMSKHVNTTGPAEILYRTRQIERAEGLAAMKKQSTLFKKRLRERAGKDLSQRAAEREQREVERRDARFSVHDMIEHSRGAGVLRSKRQFA